jgi:hypothetical protein
VNSILRMNGDLCSDIILTDGCEYKEKELN